jgi:hypothetical protein
MIPCIAADRRYFLASLLTESRSESFVAAMDTNQKRYKRAQLQRWLSNSSKSFFHAVLLTILIID